MQLELRRGELDLLPSTSIRPPPAAGGSWRLKDITGRPRRLRVLLSCENGRRAGAEVGARRSCGADRCAIARWKPLVRELRQLATSSIM